MIVPFDPIDGGLSKLIKPRIQRILSPFLFSFAVDPAMAIAGPVDLSRFFIIGRGLDEESMNQQLR